MNDFAGTAMEERWRLLLDGGASGFRHMAVDEALLGTAALARDGPWSHTLRLYWFEPPALSIGAFQPIAEVDLEACALVGIDVVRRPTGGRAVLHDGCITYAIAGSESGSVFAGGIRASYKRIAAALQSALAMLGLADITPAQPQPHTTVTPSCFDSTAPYELLTAGRKLSGSAQARRGGAALQHGSVLLAPSSVPVAKLLRSRRTAEAAGTPALGPVTVSELLGREVAREQAIAALRAAFEEALGVAFDAETLTDEERRRAAALEERFRSSEWTLRQ